MIRPNRSSDNKGQITSEYFIIAAILGIVTLVGIATFPDTMQYVLNAFINAAANLFASS